jgi:phage FluMu gp28-like protein
VALSSRPENIRGLQGKVVIDEAAFHPNVQGVMEAATALLIWGGRISVISSHNGKNNPFNQFVKDIENGVFGEDAKVHVVTFDDAVENGLYERVCFMQGKEATLEGKEKWYKKSVKLMVVVRLPCVRNLMPFHVMDRQCVAYALG